MSLSLWRRFFGLKRVSVNATVIDLISFRVLKYLIYSFPHSGIEVKRGVEFYYSTRNASKIQ